MLANLRATATARGDTAWLARLAEIGRLLDLSADRKASDEDRKAARERLKVVWFRLHDTRRVARTILSRVKVKAQAITADGSVATTDVKIEPKVRELCLGHTPKLLEATYDKYEFHAERAEALEALAAEIARITGAPPPATAANVASLAVEKAKRRAR
jgi:hypothetical protein